MRLFSLGPAVGWQADSDAEADPAAKKKGGAEAAGKKDKKEKKDKKGKKGKTDKKGQKLDGAGEGEDEDEDALRRRAELELLLLDESETPCVASTCCSHSCSHTALGRPIGCGCLPAARSGSPPSLQQPRWMATFRPALSDLLVVLLNIAAMF
jgi:hypothetical protein